MESLEFKKKDRPSNYKLKDSTDSSMLILEPYPGCRMNKALFEKAQIEANETGKEIKIEGSVTFSRGEGGKFKDLPVAKAVTTLELDGPVAFKELEFIAGLVNDDGADLKLRDVVIAPDPNFSEE